MIDEIDEIVEINQDLFKSQRGKLKLILNFRDNYDTSPLYCLCNDRSNKHLERKTWLPQSSFAIRNQRCSAVITLPLQYSQVKVQGLKKLDMVLKVRNASPKRFKI